MKYLLALPLLLGLALPAEAGHRHRNNQHRRDYTVVCTKRGCAINWREPRFRINEHCVYKPWKDKTICRF